MSHLDEGTLHAHLDGELDPIEEAELRAHLASCAECRGRLDAERSTRSRAHEILRYADPPPVATPDFAQVRARRAAKATPGETQRRPRLAPLILPWAASIVLALGVGWFAQSLLSGAGTEERGQVAIGSDATGSAEVVEPMAAAAPSRAAGAEGPEAEASSDARTLQAPATSTPDAAAVPSSARAYAPPESVATAAAPPTSAPLLVIPDESAAVWDLAWVPADSSTAERMLGSPPAILAEQPVVSYAVTSERPGSVRIIQRLPGGELLEIYQRRSPSVEVVVRSAIPADSLERLRMKLVR